MKQFGVMALVAASMMAAPVSAMAASDAAKYDRLASKAKLTLIQAIEKAQAHQGGVAVTADLDTQLGKTIFEVDVLSAGRLYEVFVDATSGDVLNVKEDLD